MAARTLYPKQGGTQFYSVAEWSLADDDAQNQSKPVAGDTIILTANSAQVLCNEAWAAAGLSHPGAGTSQWYFGTQVAVVSGDITLDKVVATVETADITATNLDVGTNGSLTSSGDWALTGDFELDGGTIVGTDDVMTLDGALVYSSGTATDLSVDHDGTNDVSWNTSGSPLLLHTIKAGATITQTGTVRSKALVVEATGVLTGAQAYAISMAGNDFLTVNGEVTNSEILFVATADYSNAGRISTTGKLTANLTTTRSITQTGETTVDGIFEVHATGAGVGTWVWGVGATLAAVRVGHATTGNRSGRVEWGSYSHTIASLAEGHVDNASENDFATANFTLSGVVDGTNISCTNTGGTIIGGTVNNVDLTGQAVLWHFWPATSGSGNTNVTEESPLLGGALMMAPALQTKS